MRIIEYIHLCRNCGQFISTINGNYFQPHGWKCYSYPLNYKITINESLVKSLKWKYLITTVFTKLKRKNAIEFVLDTNSYDINLFSRKTRNRINKSLSNCSFKKPCLEHLVSFGLEINRQTLNRQHRRDKILTSKKQWNTYISTLYSDNEIIFLGAYYKERMVGYLITFELEGEFNILHAFIDRQDSETTSPMMGLIYTLANQLIMKYGSVKISYGLDSFNAEPELCRFKRNMLFKPIPVTRVYVINPIVLLFFKLIIILNIRILGRKNIHNAFTRKIIQLYQGYRIFSKSYDKLGH